ncbi:MAG TPA: hypothetical protein VEI95_02080 [Acidobacteriota bacterium]|nr:hypothetical protein [Acidobacteriota bacterium]
MVAVHEPDCKGRERIGRKPSLRKRRVTQIALRWHGLHQLSNPHGIFVDELNQ